MPYAINFPANEVGSHKKYAYRIGEDAFLGVCTAYALLYMSVD
jgi:hypothetical protein